MASKEEATEALGRLLDGNREFVRSIAASVPAADVSRKLSAADPFAVVLGCSDSRVPPEVVLHQDIGRLFVVRVAGNVAGGRELGSIEYAVAVWRCPLVLVLGHSRCGAVAAALDPPPRGAAAVRGAGELEHLASLVSAVRANVDAGRTGQASPPEGADVWYAAVEANARRSADSLLERSSSLRRGVAAGNLTVVAAVYDVDTGVVEPLEPRATPAT